jgi:hypothetical protein
MPKHRLRPRPRKATAKIKRLMSVGRWFGQAPVFLVTKIPEKCSKLTTAYCAKYDRLRCTGRGPLRCVLSGGLSVSPRAEAVLLRAYF